MEDTGKRLTVLNMHSIRSLVDTINSRGIQKDDILKIIHKEDSYFLLYYEDCD